MECGALTSATTSTLEDLFSIQNTEVDVGMEWLSIFVEDCLSGHGSCLPPPNPSPDPTATSQVRNPQNAPPSFHSFSVTGKARSKRKRVAAAKSKSPLTTLTTPWSQTHHHFPSSDPPLLDQAYWLADSELISPAAPEEEEENEKQGKRSKNRVEEDEGVKGNMVISQPRRCAHCLSQRTPQWRAGPTGPKTLCNACGVRYKSGRLLPEYRPAKSPTFVSYLHSNSHKKVMEMRSGIGMGVGIGAESSVSAADGDEKVGCSAAD